MDPTPPRKPKENRPFYAPPEDKPSAVQIINEARSSLKELKTKRPFTPREDRRTLFGPRPVNTADNRPPSAFSLDSRHFDPDSRPVSGTRLSPLDHVARLPTESEVESLLLPPKPPTDSGKPSKTRARARYANSGDNSSADRVRSSGSETDIQSSQLSPEYEGVGALEDGSLIYPTEERGEGDGKEAPPHRAPSVTANTPLPSQRADGEERLGSGGVRRSEIEERVSSGGTHRGSSAGSRGGSAGKRDDEREEQDFYMNHIAPMLDLMAEYSQSKDAEKLISLSEELYQLLLKNGLLVKTYKQRSRILKAIFKMLDLEEPKLLLQLARLILAFRVGGNNLLNVCKLVFKVSRNEKNDPAFLDGNILDLLLETMISVDVVSTHEALIYCVGSMKFLTGNATIAKQLVGKQCIEKLSTLLDNIIKLSQESGANTEQLGNILVQLTAALRNLADASSSRDRILGCRLLESLTAASDSYSGDAEIVLNVSRIFSKVTLHTDCCLALSGYSLSYKVFLHLLKKHLKRQDIVVRVCFILGNMTAKNDEARVCLYQESKSLEIVLSVLKSYLEADYKSHSKPERKSGGSKDEISKTEDVLVKVVRVIANISINETVGPQVASSKACVELLIRILDYKDVETSEELVLNTVACINNLSYFSDKSSAITHHQIRLCDCLMKLILAENMMKSIVEVSRVFGNLTRQKQVRDYLHKEKVDVLLCTLLDSGDKEVVYIACGVLINFMVDEEKRTMLKKEKGISKLVEVLRDCGRGDWELAGMVCQTLWNYSGKITSTNACFGETESQELSEILIDFLDKESAFDPGFEQMDPEFQDYILDTWESQFCPVADQLLQRIETHNSDFEPL
ncbi:armadillo repeat-containing protein 2-like isoform X2 [Mya arenaria]|uniref:armadillo repeat-containing protein 2-like isoform X2 n=1 Tax=Mya arenaria TaxID=6604 RepID=UPI0022E75C05|nr:armadillo repeat-containing protein 2-like isoform X2 [Mya arenaria]XP_052809662.1 armadillo repeat-containing protein 2-like isoform X2 [Mya arenaria]